MPYKDPVVRREKGRELDRRRRAKKHAERYGIGAGDQRGRHGNQARGPANGRWNDGRMLTSHGYVLVRVPDGHHLQQAHGYAYEHQVVAEQKLGRRLRDGEVVHHLNGDRSDSRQENLCVGAWPDHARAHVSSASCRDELGRFKRGPRCLAGDGDVTHEADSDD